MFHDSQDIDCVIRLFTMFLATVVHDIIRGVYARLKQSRLANLVLSVVSAS